MSAVSLEERTVPDAAAERLLQGFMQRVRGEEPKPTIAIRTDLNPVTAPQNKQSTEVSTRVGVYIPLNYHGQPSGKLTLDEQGRMTGGIAYINYTEYTIIPLLHPPDKDPSWGINTKERKLFVNNNLSVEYA